MQRITITIDDGLLAALDAYMEGRTYSSRSEAIRDMLREKLARERLRDPSAECIAAFTYVYLHDVRDLARRLTHAHHERHDLSVAALHIHLDHDDCLEISVLKGPLGGIESFAHAIASQRGVRHSDLHVIPARIVTHEHSHGDRKGPHQHVEI